jgi:hypothetical protein
MHTGLWIKVVSHISNNEILNFSRYKFDSNHIYFPLSQSRTRLEKSKFFFVTGIELNVFQITIYKSESKQTS